MACPECGSSNAADARFCSSCGAALTKQPVLSNPVGESEPPPRPKRSAAKTVLQGCVLLVLALAIVIAIVILVVVISANTSSNNRSNTKTSAPAPTAPPDEAAFLAAKVAVESRFDNAPNDMVKHQIAGAWRNGGTCSALKTATFTNWIGTIAKIEYNGDLYVDLGDNVTLDASIHTASPLFKVVSTLKEGDAVEVSGVFDPGTIDRVLNGGAPKCMAVATTDNLLDEDSGTVKTPHFNVTFSRVAPQSDLSSPAGGVVIYGICSYPSGCGASGDWFDETRPQDLTYARAYQTCLNTDVSKAPDLAELRTRCAAKAGIAEIQDGSNYSGPVVKVSP